MHKIRLTYRAFARQARAVEDQFERVYQTVLELCHQSSWAREVDPVHVSGPDTSYWPLSSEAVDNAREEGLATAFDEETGIIVALIRQWVITIILEEQVKADNIPGFIGEIWEKAGEVFTNIETVETVFTNVSPQ